MTEQTVTLTLPVSVVATALGALNQLSVSAQNASALIQGQANAQLAPVAVAEPETRPV